MAQLDIWRVQAFKRLDELIGAMPKDITTNDGLIDALVRCLAKQPPRPADKAPYEGIFALKDALEGRKKAIERFRVLSATLQGALNPIDGQVDDLVRALGNLPKRPADKQPYASLFAPSKVKFLSAIDLLQIAPEAPVDMVENLMPELNRAMIEFDIDTPLRQAHFLAQVAHECDRFHALEEYASGEDYEWREDLGNVYPGDGVRFKGRGLIQITGRNNYKECGNALGVNLISNPKRLSDLDLASRSAAWYWESRKINPVADRDDVEAVTLIINGGDNGLDDRIRLLASAKQVLGL
jgi:putative chitinase